MGKYSHEENGITVYGASSLGSCSAALFYDRFGITGEPAPEWLTKAWGEGNDNELWILAMLESQAVWKCVLNDELATMDYEFGTWNEQRQVDYAKQVKIEKKIGTNILVRSHLDSIVRMHAVPPMWDPVRLGEWRIGEVKAFGDTLWDKFQKNKADVTLSWFPSYAWQVSFQMIATQLPLLFIVGHKGKDGRCFELDYIEIDHPPISWGTMVKKLLTIEKYVEIGDICNVPECEKPIMYPCPFYKFHEIEGAVELEDLDAILLDSLADEYERHRLAEKDHKEKKQGVGTRLLETLALSPSGVKGKIYEVDLAERKNKGGLDESKMKANDIDVESYRLPGSVSSYPRVKRLGGNDARQ